RVNRLCPRISSSPTAWCAQPRACSRRSVLSVESSLQSFGVQHGLGQQFLEPSVLFLKSFQATGFRDFQAAILLAPGVEGCVRDVVLPAELFDRKASLGFLQNGNDLFFGESLLHVHRPLW